MVTAAQQPSLLIRHGTQEPFREPKVSGYANESELQQILYQHPALLPGVEGTAVACREFQSGAGPADVVVLHGEGDLVITECKWLRTPRFAVRWWGR
jgi:RecB family endonuclease NucS